MAVEVSDRSSNKVENIEHAVEVLGRSKVRRAVFNAVYSGRGPTKTATELAGATGHSRQQVLNEAKRLADSGLVKQTTKNGETAYEKDRFYQSNRLTVLRYADAPEKLAAKPTKRRPASSGRVEVKISLSKKRVRATHLTIDDIGSFSKVRRIQYKGPWVSLSEANFKQGFAKILGEKGVFKDWGGESADLVSTLLMIGGKRRACAIAFKGPGTKGKLTPAKMGKNGDQIQRLAQCPAEVYLVQYSGQIDSSVLLQLEMLIQFKSYVQDRQLWYGIIDGHDSSRLVKAYAKDYGWGTTP